MGDESRRRFGVRNLLALGALAGWSWWVAGLDPDLGLPGTDLMSLARGLPRQAAWFVPVGLLVPLALPRMRSFTGRFLLVLLPSFVIAAAVAAAITAAPPDAPWTVFSDFAFPSPLTLIVPVAGTAVGVMLGALLAGGVGGALVLIPALLALAVVLLAMAAVVLLLLTDRIPAAEPIGEMGAAGSRTLLNDLRDGVPIGTEGVALALPLLVEAGLDPSARIRLEPADEGVLAQVSLPWDLPLAGVRYLNAELAADPSTEGGALRLGLRSASIGGVRAPTFLVRTASWAASAWANQFLPLSGPPGIHAGFDRRLAEVLDALEGKVAEIHAGPDRLAVAIRAAFALSRDPSGGADAVEENRVALLALAGAAGHPSLLALAGFPDSAEVASRLGRELEVTARRRGDWARHFLLSAGLTQVGPAGMTEQAGDLKERLDATSGSGFSFSDLMMDRAGVRFGRSATGSSAAAERLRARIAAGISDADLVPDVAGLPDGLSHARLEAEFGGVGGGGFRKMEAEIERRIASLTLYR